MMKRTSKLDTRSPCHFLTIYLVEKKIKNIHKFTDWRLSFYDSPQRFIRHLALSSGKTIYMAVPRLRERKCFIKLNPSKIPSQKILEASSIKGAFRYGSPVHPKEILQIDLIVAGSVAVNRKGSRIGKGGGYSDLEYAIGREFGFVKEDVVIVTTVHPLQIVDQDLPETDHDFLIDFIVTPDGIIPTHRNKAAARRELLGRIWPNKKSPKSQS